MEPEKLNMKESVLIWTGVLSSRAAIYSYLWGWAFCITNPAKA